MNIIPIMKCEDINEALSFYTQVLDFEDLYPEDKFPYKLLIREGARLDLSSIDGGIASCVYIQVENVDSLFAKFIERGLDVKIGEGVHGGPLDQTWGMREFYVTDKDNNTLRFGHPIE